MRSVLIEPPAPSDLAPISEEMLEACLEAIAEERFSDDAKRNKEIKLAVASEFIGRCRDVADVTMDHIAMTLGISRARVGQIELKLLRKCRADRVLAEIAGARHVPYKHMPHGKQRAWKGGDL